MAGHPLKNAASIVDRTLAEGMERQVAAHHGRPGNSLDLLIDAETALPRMAEVLLSARTGVSAGPHSAARALPRAALR